MASAICQNQFLGSRISLVSKSEIRYEGILYALDLNEATISLAKVRSFGTEDRPTERPVPPRDDTFEYIVFRGPDIKIIDVVEPPKHASNAVMAVPADPAIVDFSHPNGGGGHFNGHYEGGGRQRQNNRGRGGGGPQNMFNMGSPQRRRPGGYGNEGGMQNGRGNMNRNMNGGQGGRQNNGQSSGGRMNYGGNFRQGFIPNGGQFQQRGRMTTPNRGGNYGQPQRRGRQQGGGGGGNRYQPRNRGMNAGAFPPKVAFDADYDFEKANEELISSLAKAKLDDENPDNKSDDGDSQKDGDAESKEPAIFYKKDNFFDSISCESLERSKGNVPRVDWKAERKLNEETFGIAPNSNGGNRSNRRGQGQRMPHGMPNIFRQGGGNWMSPNKFYNYNNGGNNPRRVRSNMM